VDSHPVDVCRPAREGKKKRLGGMAKRGYCASLKRWYIGIREHLFFTLDGRLAFLVQVAGNRHDTQGLYALLETAFRGALLADNRYWPSAEKRAELEKHGVTILACTRSNQKFRHTPEDAALLKKHRPHAERFIGLFDAQFFAARTLNRKWENYLARRWCKAVAHNGSRFVNRLRGWAVDSVAHLRRVS
jgi:IS5 family transposase